MKNSEIQTTLHRYSQKWIYEKYTDGYNTGYNLLVLQNNTKAVFWKIDIS